MTRRVHLWGPPPEGKKGLQRTLCGRPVWWPTRRALYMAGASQQRPAAPLEVCSQCRKKSTAPRGPTPAG